jgi:hypothetical protein
VQALRLEKIPHGNDIANEWHELEALEDGTVFVNVFAEGKY